MDEGLANIIRPFNTKYTQAKPGCYFPNRIKLVILFVMGRYEKAAEQNDL